MREYVSYWDNNSIQLCDDFKTISIYHVGDTADITVHQKCEDNTLEEILPPTVGPWGGNSVNDQFVKFLIESMGKRVFDEFKRKHVEDYVDMKRGFEAKKRSFKAEPGGVIRIPMPQTLGKKFNKVKTFQEAIDKNEMLKGVEFSTGKLIMDNCLFGSFFKKSIDGIVKHIDEILQVIPVCIHIILYIYLFLSISFYYYFLLKFHNSVNKT